MTTTSTRTIPVLRFTPRADGLPPEALQAGNAIPQVVPPTGGEPLYVLRDLAAIRSCLTSDSWAMAGTDAAGRLRDHPVTGAERQDPDGGLLNMDGPVHRDIRRRINPLFTPAAASALDGFTRHTAHDLAQALRRRGQAELVSGYADALVAAVVCRALGLPLADWPQVLLSSLNAFGVVQGPAQIASADEGWQETYAFYQHALAGGQAHPDGAIAGIASALRGRYNDRQVVHVLANVANGYPAMQQALRRILWELLTRRRALLVALRQGRCSGQEVADCLLGTVALFAIDLPRRAVTDTRLGGRLYHEGELVLPSLAAAAGGPQDHARPSARVAFSWGVHACPGAPLTRKVMVHAVESLAGICPGLELAEADPPVGGSTLTAPVRLTVRARLRCRPQTLP